MPDIKLRDGSGVEQTYTGVDTITVPLADGSGNFTYGLTDEQLTFSNGMYNFYKGNNKKILAENKSRIKINDTDGALDNTFAYSDETDLSPVEINIEEVNYQRYKMRNAFYRCGNLQKLPILNLPKGESKIQLFGNQSGDIFNNCYKLREDEIKKWTTKFYNKDSYQRFQWCIYCHSLRDGTGLFPQDLFDYRMTSKVWGGPVGYCFAIEKIEVPIFNLKYETTTNVQSIWWDNCYRCSSVKFMAQENGQPHKVKWKNQIVDFNVDNMGYDRGTSYYKEWFAPYSVNRITQSKNIFGDYYNISSGDFSKAKTYIAQKYQELKNDPDWFALGYFSDTYEGKSVPWAQLYSRYNHDSAVETLNSLPDTSEYLATAGGTNTIKFRGYQGALTDGGAINTLTEEEIAVATAKGWTVTFV